MTPVEILKGARTLLTNPEHWTQKELARRSDGLSVHPCDLGACHWCALGALIHCAGLNAISLQPFSEARTFLNGIAFRLGASTSSNLQGAAQINDTTTHATVLSMFDEAIKTAEAA